MNVNSQILVSDVRNVHRQRKTIINPRILSFSKQIYANVSEKRLLRKCEIETWFTMTFVILDGC